MLEDKTTLKDDTLTIETETQLPAEQSIQQKIEAIETTEDLKEVTTAFNLNIAKKELSRALKQDELLDIILNQASERLQKHPSELSTKDLLDYMDVFQNNLNRVQGVVEKAETTPVIQINDNKKVVVAIDSLSRQSSEKVLNTLKEIFSEIDSSQESIEDLLNTVQVANIDEEK